MVEKRRPLIRQIVSIALIIGLIWPVGAGSEHSNDTIALDHPAAVKDISDRAYQRAVITLLDSAEESIVISMYIIKPTKGGPIALLLNDLIEALDRGVTVEIYQNGKYRPQEILDPSDEKKAFDALREKGALVYKADTNYLLHDKLIIVDSRYVIEGSANWSVSALKSNFESNTLIDSYGLAEVKLERLRNLPLENEKLAKIRRRYLAGEPADLAAGGTIGIKKILLENENFFPRMVKYQSNRAMEMYLLLLADGERWRIARNEKDEEHGIFASDREDAYFPVSLEKMADDLGIEALGPWPVSTKRRQVIKALRSLKERYKLIDPVFDHGEDAWVTLEEIPGDTFQIENSFFDPGSLSSKSSSAKYVLLIKAMLASEGKTLDSYTRKELAKRFHIGLGALRTGINELKKE
jgi:HKD family nuclease